MGHVRPGGEDEVEELTTEAFTPSEMDDRLQSIRVEEVVSSETTTIPLDSLLVPPDKDIRILVRPLTRSRSVSPGSHESCKWLALHAEVAEPDVPQHKVLAVTQTSRDIKFSVRIPPESGQNQGPARPPLWCELYYDPASDNQILLNRSDVPISLARISNDVVASPPGLAFVANPGMTKALSPGTWRIKVNKVDVLDFRILEKRPAAFKLPSVQSSSGAASSILSDMVNSSGKRSFVANEDDAPGEARKLRVTESAKHDDGVIMFLRQKADPLVFPLPKADPLVFPLPNADPLHKAAKGAELVAINGHALLEMQRDETVEIPGGFELDAYQITKREPIASTSLSSVYTANHSSVPDGIITVKVLKTRTPPPPPGSLAKPVDSERNVIRQADIWLREFQSHDDLHHNNIPRLYGGDARHLSLYMEHVDAKDLSARAVWRHDGSDLFRGDGADARRILRDIAGALDYIHSRNLVHNDIKPANILYSRERGAVLCDFGLSTHTSNPATAGGTPYYVPPEFIGHKLRGAPSDVWALGVTMLYVLRKIAFPDARGRAHHPRRLYWIIADLNRPSTFYRKSSASAAAVSQMQQWLREINEAKSKLDMHDPCERLVADMLIPHPSQRITMKAMRDVIKDLYKP